MDALWFETQLRGRGPLDGGHFTFVSLHSLWFPMGGNDGYPYTTGNYGFEPKVFRRRPAHWGTPQGLWPPKVQYHYKQRLPAGKELVVRKRGSSSWFQSSRRDIGFQGPMVVSV